jgi:hypothetical protein
MLLDAAIDELLSYRQITDRLAAELVRNQPEISKRPRSKTHVVVENQA